MCTVTFIPSGDQIFLVSNRDEKHTRPDAHEPVAYSTPLGHVLYPKDTAGGSWIAMHANGNAVVLLNGGTEAHVADPPYRKSRGLVLLDLIIEPSPGSAFLSLDLHNIEPFTVVCWDNGRLLEGVWDGENRHISRKDEKRPHIWSSVTLYDRDIRKRREGWFRDWLNDCKYPVLEDVLHFHQFTGDGDQHNDLLMNRSGELYTVSITGMKIGKENGQMIYRDLRNNRLSISGLMFSSCPSVH